MNYLVHGGHLSRFSRISYTAVPLHHQRYVLAPPRAYEEPVIKAALPSASTDHALFSRLCKGRVRATCRLGAPTHVRWASGCVPQCGQQAKTPAPEEKPLLYRDLEFPSFDAYRKKEFRDVNYTTGAMGEEKPGVAYTMSFFGLVVGAYSAKTVVTFLVSSMSASADVLAQAVIEVSLGDIPEGKTVTVKWRGKPLFIKHRTQAEIHHERETPVTALRHPQTDAERAQNPSWLVVIGICTHLGCVPIADSGDFPGGFYCPCHGSHYDAAGRIRKGPAPLNLEIPPYKFDSESTLLIG